MPQSRRALDPPGLGRLKLLLLALAAAATLAALTLSAGAQPSDVGSGTAQGRIIARVQDRTGEDGVDNYRIEFGFFPEWTLNEADPWSAAIASRSSWLPSSRFLTKSRIDARAAADNRNWLRSSLITVPAQSPGGAAEITGRVIARYNPDSAGRLRVEFGFVPEWAFADSSSTEEAVRSLGVDGLPRARYLRVAAIDARRDVWLRSSQIEVSLRAPPAFIDWQNLPELHDITCSPSSPLVDESVACTVAISGGDPVSWAWRGGAAPGDSETYVTSFSEAGAHTIWVTATYDDGSRASISTTVSVEGPLRPPAINSISCTPSAPEVDEDVTCTADLSGGAPDSWVWSGGVDNGDAAYYYTSFASAGETAVSLTLSNAAGSDTESITLTVEPQPLQAPLIDSIGCTPFSPEVDEDVTCTADLSGGAPESHAWSGGASNGSEAVYSPSFSEEGDYAISLTVANRAGSATHSFTLTVLGEVEPPVIDAINCSPASPRIDTDVTCTADLSGDEPESYAWRVGSSSGDGETYTTSFSTAGDYAVSLNVTNRAGSATHTIMLTVLGEVEPPVIDAIDCSPSAPTIDADVTCAPSLSGDEPESYAWRVGSSSDDGDSYTTSFSKAGDYAVSLTVTNAAGSDSESITLTVGALSAPVIDRISCPPPPTPNNENNTQVACLADLSGGAPDSYTWSGGITDGTEESYLTDNQALYFVFVDPAGDLTISLTVTNAAGSDSDSITVAFNDGSMIPGGPIDDAPTDGGPMEPMVAGPVDAGPTSDGGRTGGDAPSIDSISCSPSPPVVNSHITCMATLRGGAPDSYSWSGGDSAGNERIYATSFSEVGDHIVSLTVANTAGSDTSSTSVDVNRIPECSASGTRSFTVGDSWSGTAKEFVEGIVTCTDDDPLTYRLSLGSDLPTVSVSESNGVWTVQTVAAGIAHLHIRASDPAGFADTAVLTVTVASAPIINGISCSPSSPTVEDHVTCTAALGVAYPDSYSYSWSGGDHTGSWEDYDTRFDSAGTHTVELTVTNSVGSASASHSIVVREAPALADN